MYKEHYINKDLSNLNLRFYLCCALTFTTANLGNIELLKYSDIQSTLICYSMALISDYGMRQASNEITKIEKSIK